MHHLHFNHVALLVSALLQWFLGAIWYSPVLFAKPWMAIVGIQPGNAKKSSMITGMIIGRRSAEDIKDPAKPKSRE